MVLPGVLVPYLSDKYGSARIGLFMLGSANSCQFCWFLEGSNDLPEISAKIKLSFVIWFNMVTLQICLSKSQIV